jgi:hypothetical protein
MAVAAAVAVAAGREGAGMLRRVRARVCARGEERPRDES